jgi:hypothetical protein
MSQSQVHVKYTRGGREFSRRSLSLEEVQQPFRNHLPGGFISGLGNHFELYVRCEETEKEISAHNDGSSNFESLLRAVSQNGEISGKTFIIDCTAEHRGAHE